MLRTCEPRHISPWMWLIPLLLNASAAISDEFFGSTLSERERYSFDSSMESLESTMESVDAMQMLMMYSAFAEGRCGEYFSVESAAKEGDAKNQYILSDLYRQGYCVPQDDARALYWVGQAAEGGYEMAFYDLGIFLTYGIGTEKRPAAAVPWFEKAAATRIEAHHHLALLYLYGEGVPQNYSKAHDYALRGAMLGDPPAQGITAMISAQQGYDFTNLVDAYKWALIANASGRENVVDALAELTSGLEETLSTSQIARAQAAAARFTPLSLEPTAPVDPTDVDLPNVDVNELVDISASEALARMNALGLTRDRFLFFKAIAENNVGVTALYLLAGASPETTSPTLYDSALLHAARNGSVTVARLLVAAGANIDRSVNHDHDTPVLLAMSGHHRELTDFLIAKGAKLDHPGIMFNAVEFNDPELLAMLKSKGVALDEDYVGTPLSNAISSFDAEGERRCLYDSAKYLIDEGARLDYIDMHGESLLQSAVDTVNPTDCVRLLLESGMEPVGEHGREPLFLAIIGGKSDVVELLLEHGAEPGLSYELAAGQVPMILEGDAKSSVMNGGSILQLAVAEQHAAIARHLVRYGADPNDADELGRTPLSIARERGDSLMVSVLRGEM